MPTRNAIKQYAPQSYYHVYSRGVNKRKIFLDDDDYAFFLSLFKRYLSKKPASRKKHAPYRHFLGQIELLSFCLMPNHVHLFIYQADDMYAMKEFLAAVMTSYSRYFNQKYERVGPLFQSRYLASRILRDDYLQHISRYIHLNPRNWATYPYSSIKYFQGKAYAEWIDPQRVLDIFNGSTVEYMNFLKDHDDYKQSLEQIDLDLAHE